MEFKQLLPVMYILSQQGKPYNCLGRQHRELAIFGIVWIMPPKMAIGVQNLFPSLLSKYLCLVHQRYLRNISI